MKILVPGATGLIGRALVPALLLNGYHVTVISRNPEKAKKIFPTAVTALSWQQLDALLPDMFIAVINLAGENIADARWTKKRKANLMHSRVDTTRQLVQWLLTANKGKPHLYNASAIGIYPAALSSDANTFTEETVLPGKATSFAAELVREWEAATLPAVARHISVTLLRFAVVLKRHEGILKKLEWPFALGLGNILGKGEQVFSWIHINDLINVILFLLKKPEIVGPVNLCAPYCVTQKIFAQVLASMLHRPLFMIMPEWLIKILFGQMGEELLLSGQAVCPARLEKQGFNFVYPTIQAALKEEFE